MSLQNVLAQLPALQAQSSVSLSNSVVTGLTLSLTQARNRLMRAERNPNGWGHIYVPTGGPATLLQNLSSRRVVWTARQGNDFLQTLNHELKGGDSYPVLVTVLGTGVGLVPVVGTAAGLLFSAATTGIDLMRTSHSVIARPGDEVWQIEEIGRFAGKVMHVGAYLVVDPYRRQAPEKGWLIHEERTELTLV